MTSKSNSAPVLEKGTYPSSSISSTNTNAFISLTCGPLTLPAGERGGVRGDPVERNEI